MNNKGFAISTMLYGLIIVISLVMVTILSTMSFNRKTSKEFSSTIVDELENIEKVKLYKVGDYISMTPTKSTYTVQSSLTGSSNVTITPSELTLWRVININSDGTVEVISEYVSSTLIKFKGTIGYTNYVGALNEIASQYENSRYTVKSRMIGFNDQTTNLQNTFAYDGSFANPPWTTSTTTTLNNKPTDEDKGAGDTLYSKDSSFLTKENKVRTTTPTGYWIASRNYIYRSSSNYSFNGRYVDSNGSVGNVPFRYYNSAWNDGGADVGLALRPVLTLNTLSAIYGGTGTKDDPYLLPT